MSLPDYNFLAAPLWLITMLHIATFTLHLIAMNFMAGGVVVILFGKFNDRWSDPAVRQLVKLFPSAMAATVTFGVAPLLFLQLVFGRLVYSASIVSAWFWLMIVAVVIIGYYFLYGAAFAEKDRGKRIRTCLTISLFCFIYVSFIYSSVFSMAERPELIKMLYAGNQSGLVINPDIGSYIFRWLHMLTGAVMVGSFFTGWIGRNSGEVFSVSRKFYLYGMAAAMIFGLGYLMTLGDYMAPFMHSAAPFLLLVSVILSLGSLFFFFRKQFIPAGLMLLISFAGMVATRFIVRLIRLKDFFDPAAIPVKPQWTAFAVFIICFVAAIGLLWYMLKLFFGKYQEEA